MYRNGQHKTYWSNSKVVYESERDKKSTDSPQTTITVCEG